MGNHPNRSKRRPVCDTTWNASVIGEAASEEEALVILRAHFGAEASITGAKRANVLLTRAVEGGRNLLAWIPTTHD